MTAYERSLAPERLGALGRNTHLGEMIGAWAGRQAEEELTQGFNRMLVDRVWDVWDKGRKEGRAAEFVNLSDPDLDDPVQAEARKLVPQEMRDYIRQKFGDNGFMVRRDMVNNTTGYRAASVGDAWTGLSRFDEMSRKAFVDMATVVLGKNAFPWLTRAEKLWQEGISAAKHTIVIRSIIVPASNLISNFFQFTSLGVGLLLSAAWITPTGPRSMTGSPLEPDTLARGLVVSREPRPDIPIGAADDRNEPELGIHVVRARVKRSFLVFRDGEIQRVRQFSRVHRRHSYTL